MQIVGLTRNHLSLHQLLVAFFLESIAFCNCFAIFFFSSRHFWNIWEFGVKKHFTDHRTANTIQLALTIKGNFSGLFFLNKSQQRGILQRLVGKCSQPFICAPSKYTLSSGQNPA